MHEDHERVSERDMLAEAAGGGPVTDVAFNGAWGDREAEIGVGGTVDTDGHFDSAPMGVESAPHPTCWFDEKQFEREATPVLLEVRRWLRSQIVDTHTCDDLVQFLSERMWFGCPLDVILRKNLRAWAFSVLRHELQHMWIQARRRASSPLPIDGPQDKGLTPHDEAVGRELASRIELAMGQLSQPDQQILDLKCYKGKSDIQIATALGISHGAARKRLERARHRLAQLLELDDQNDLD